MTLYSFTVDTVFYFGIDIEKDHAHKNETKKGRLIKIKLKFKRQTIIVNKLIKRQVEKRFFKNN